MQKILLTFSKKKKSADKANPNQTAKKLIDNPDNARIQALKIDLIQTRAHTITSSQTPV
jgi:hypothetical protein